MERSIIVSAPQLTAHPIFSTSSSAVELTAELPILAFILMRKLRPMTMGSGSACLMLDGNDGAAARDLLAHEFRRDEERHRSAKAFAVVLRRLRDFEYFLCGRDFRARRCRSFPW